jgi:dCMP deaminase
MEFKTLGDFANYIPPTWDMLFMRLVYEYASKSKDPSSKIGAVIVRDNRPILFGYNGFPEGVKDTPERLNDRDTKYMLVEHAERNAIDMAAAMGTSTVGGILYTQILPCAGCAKPIIQSKIREIVIHQPADEYFQTKCSTGANWARDHEFSKIMFEESGVCVRYFNELTNCIGYFGGKMISL